jgi:hypothetical protein
MGVWRDPQCGRSHQPKKRARYEHGSWTRPMKDFGSWRCQKNNLRLLTTDRLMGVTVISVISFCSSRHHHAIEHAHSRQRAAGHAVHRTGRAFARFSGWKRQCAESSRDKLTRRANHFRFTERRVKRKISENQKYFAFPELRNRV